MDFYIDDGVKYTKINSISEADLIADDDELNSERIYGGFTDDPVEISFQGEVVDERGRNVVRMLVSGGDKGLYNGMTLKADGYLSPKNAWL